MHGRAAPDWKAKARGKAGPDRVAMARGKAAPDRVAMARAIAAFLDAARIPMARTDRAKTPGRVAEAWCEDLLAGYALDPETQLTSEPLMSGDGAMVVVRDIAFHSVCVHHLLPFFGRAHIAYLPGRRLAGLSKIVRAVDILARRLQLQERLTNGIVDALDAALRPAGVACVVEAEHLCVSCRGVRKPGARVLTSRFSGRLARDPLRSEALRLLDPR